MIEVSFVKNLLDEFGSIIFLFRPLLFRSNFHNCAHTNPFSRFNFLAAHNVEESSEDFMFRFGNLRSLFIRSRDAAVFVYVIVD